MNQDMNQESKRVVSARRRALSARGPRSLVLLLSFTLPVAAQSARVVVSTTDDVAASAGIPFPVTDGDLVVVEEQQSVRPFLADGHFLATCGFRPSDVDAFAYLPGSRPGRGSGKVFSLLSNEGGFLDGDLLVLSDGGVSLMISELDLTTAMGVPLANVDVDAITYDDQGLLLFSLNADLNGTILGTVQDGDILRLELGFAGVTRVLSESEAQTRFTLATGLIDPILDVQALDWASGELWAAVQSPSRHDGSILAIGSAPQVVQDENDMGLGGAEVDALCALRAGDELPVFHMSPGVALPGDTVHIETRGEPGALLMVLMAGNTGFINFSRFPGFGGWYFSPTDPLLNALLTTQAIPFAQLDGAGEFSVDWTVPIGLTAGLGLGGESGWSFQLMDVQSKELSAPFRMEQF